MVCHGFLVVLKRRDEICWTLSYYRNRIFNLVSLDNGAKMSPKRRTFLSLVFACICISKSLLIVINFQLSNCILSTVPLLKVEKIFGVFLALVPLRLGS